MASASNPIQPLPGPFDVTLADLPGSKSLTNRALLLAALCDDTCTLRGVLEADDTERMMKALTGLGFAVQPLDDLDVYTVQGLSGAIAATRADLNLGNAGTAFRFLTAACCLGDRDSRYRLDGVERMRQRPIGQLVDALHGIGGRIRYDGAEGFPPLTVSGGLSKGSGLRGGELDMAPTLSSQYLSALLQVGPYCEHGLTLRFAGPVTSQPYVAMTLNLMARFGVAAEVDPAFTRITVNPGRYRAIDYTIEPDASNASYFLAAAAVTPGGKCTIEGLGKHSVQGDVGFADVLRQMGAGLLFGKDFITVLGPPGAERLRGIDVELNHMPDMAQTLAVVALFAEGETVIRNVGNLRVKETDRLAALRNELTKLGAAVAIKGDDLRITPPTGNRIRPAAIDTYDDHRMAMSFAVAGLAAPGVTINDPACVNKTFPRFFEYLQRLRC